MRHAALLALCLTWACGGNANIEGADVQQEDTDSVDPAWDGDDADPLPDPVDTHEEGEGDDGAEDVSEEELPSDYDGVLCGFDICMAPEICCWRDGYPPAPECMTGEECLACDSCFFPQRCDGPEDCPGLENCCFYGGDFLAESTCSDAAGCDRQCHDGDDCETGEMCCGYLTEHHILLNHCYEGEICPP